VAIRGHALPLGKHRCRLALDQVAPLPACDDHVVWLDHAQAHVIHFPRNGGERNHPSDLPLLAYARNILSAPIVRADQPWGCRMSYKTILVHVDESAHADEQIEIAAHLATKYDAHLIGLAATGVSAQFSFPGAMGEGTFNLASILEPLRQRTDSVLAKFEALARKFDVASYEKRVVDDDAGASLSLQARYADLVVIGQIDADAPALFGAADFPQYVLLNSGRPVLIVPYAGHFTHVGKRVLVAWDASTAATRAVTAAIPILKQADFVQVVVFNAEKQPWIHGEQPGTDIALYLARHGIKIEVSQQTTPSALRVGNALLSHALDCNADLLVMGGYGHSRFREVVLGGVTRAILSEMTIPVLMSH
jgi:nucleotide-binding universal stress UspA family protein